MKDRLKCMATQLEKISIKYDFFEYEKYISYFAFISK
jgi:hypothetical protein